MGSLAERKDRTPSNVILSQTSAGRFEYGRTYFAGIGRAS
jgi:hypothetical protein